MDVAHVGDEFVAIKLLVSGLWAEIRVYVHQRNIKFSAGMCDMV